MERPGYDLQAEVSSPKFTLRFLPTVMAVNTSCGPAVCQALGRTEHTSSQLNLHGGPWGSHSHPILQMGEIQCPEKLSNFLEEAELEFESK